MNPVVPEPFTEKTILSPLKCPGHPVKSVDLNVSLFLDSHFHILMPVPHCLDYCNFIVSFETGKHKSSNLFFEKIVLAIQGPLSFRIRLSFSAKKPPGVSTGTALNLSIQGVSPSEQCDVSDP